MGNSTLAATGARPLTITTPLGKDVLLIVGLTGHEAISQLFNFQLDLLAWNDTVVPFDKLLGQQVTVNLLTPAGQKRYFNGLCIRFSQGRRDENFTFYRMEIVPQFWLLTRRACIRTFQHITVPDILKQVLDGLDVRFEIQGTFQERDYVTQYRETDFNLASRLMEEEGIYYFFTHSESGHTMVVANTPQSHPEMPINAKVIYEELEGGKREEDRILGWEKVQELRTGHHTFWDHSFELPYKSLKATVPILESVQVGKVTHKLKVGGSDQFELYDYPGDYAGRFDGVDRGGQPQPAELQKIFQDNQRTARIRMEQEAIQSLVIQGFSTCRQFTSGHKFTLQRHFNADGDYVLSSVQHEVHASQDYRSGQTGEYRYQNSFTCIPFALPFRPPRVTPKPTVEGTHTAVVVGPPGEEIFTDKYGRVKVQFNWDREASHNADSSCWVRVTQPWSGQRWGMYHIPRVGQEVIVDFLEGDPDQPIITGTVYNAHQMPAYLGDGLDPQHPHNPHLSGIKTSSTPGGDGYNELRFCDTKGKEQVFIHAEHNYDTRVKNDSMENIDHDKHMVVGKEDGGSGAGGGSGNGAGGGGGGNLLEQIQKNKHQQVKGSHFEKIVKDMQKLIGGNHDHVTKGQQNERVEKNNNVHVKGDRKMLVDGKQDITVGGDQKELVKGDDHHHVNGDRKAQVDGNQDLTVQKDQKETIQGESNCHVSKEYYLTVDKKVHFQFSDDQQHTVGGDYGLGVGQAFSLQVKDKVVIEAKEITLKAQGGFIKIDSSGTIIQGTKVKINSGGSPGQCKQIKSESAKDADAPDDAEKPDEAQEAKPDPPTPADKTVTGIASVKGYPGGEQTA
jgi:type VI secretion system secreted protein VgrG